MSERCFKCGGIHPDMGIAGCPIQPVIRTMDVHDLGRAGTSIVEGWLVEEQRKSAILREALEWMLVKLDEQTQVDDCNCAICTCAIIARDALLRAEKGDSVATASEAILDDSARRREPDHSADAGKMVAPEPEVRSCETCKWGEDMRADECFQCSRFDREDYWTPAESEEGS